MCITDVPDIYHTHESLYEAGYGILLVNFFFETLFETLAKIDLGGRRTARELRDHQETHFGERFYKNLHSQLPLAAENHHLQV